MNNKMLLMVIDVQIQYLNANYMIIPYNTPFFCVATFPIPHWDLHYHK